MTALMEDKDVYLASFAEFEKGLHESTRSPLHRVRQTAIERFAALGFPTQDEEEWRFTNIAPLTRIPFQLAASECPFTPARVQEIAFTAGTCHCLVFLNGRYAAELSTVRSLPSGVVAGSLAEGLQRQHAAIPLHLARYADDEEQPFVALNTAFIQDGAFVFLPRGAVVSEPIHLLFISTATGAPTVSYPRTLIIAEANSQATLVESYVGADEQVYFTNAVTEVAAGEHAVLDHYKLLRESRTAFHVATLQIHQDRGSHFSSHAVTLGSSLIRNDINAVLDAEGCESVLNGLYLADGQQCIDNHTRIDHAKPHCASHELYKGILNDQAHGVFNGKIYVHQDAQKTDAKQTNQTLLLSQDATINTKPQLEIYADDVKCTHGATVGQLDAESIFYLRSRGIGREEAQQLLTYAFANDIISRIKVEPLRVQLEEILLARQRLAREEKGDKNP